MATKDLAKIFLSASIPYKDRDRQYYDTADIVAIRDAVRALATVVIPKAHLIWGGHPSITPLIRYVMDRMQADLKQHVTLYQSLYFEDKFPKDNFAFENVILTPKQETVAQSVQIMRERIFQENAFSAGIFIGGMEGIQVEYEMFIAANPDAIIIPIASTGGAAKILYDSIDNLTDERLVNDYAYMALFRNILNDLI